MWDVIIVVLTLEGGGGGPGHDELHEYSCRRAPYHALPCHSYYIVLYHECSCRGSPSMPCHATHITLCPIMNALAGGLPTMPCQPYYTVSYHECSCSRTPPSCHAVFRIRNQIRIQSQWVFWIRILIWIRNPDPDPGA